MKNIISKKRKSGETLIEAIISIAVFAMVMLAVSTLLNVSTRMLSASSEQYQKIEAACNRIERSTYEAAGTEASVEYHFSKDGAAPGQATQKVTWYKEGSIAFFVPKDE